jgi:hypothetical protein
MPDDRLARITRAFNTAFRRLCAAENIDDVEDEVSNLLHHHYRLGELRRQGRGRAEFYAVLEESDALKTAKAALWARTFDTHDLMRVSLLGDRFSDFFTNLVYVPVWRPLAELRFRTRSVRPRRPLSRVPRGSHRARQHAESLRCAVRALIAAGRCVVSTEVLPNGRAQRITQPHDLAAHVPLTCADADGAARVNTRDDGLHRLRA